VQMYVPPTIRVHKYIFLKRLHFYESVVVSLTIFCLCYNVIVHWCCLDCNVLSCSLYMVVYLYLIWIVMF